MKMLNLILHQHFKKDYKLMAKRGKDLRKIDNIIKKLIADLQLEPKYRDYVLIGEHKGYRECHIEPDWLLIYKKDEDSLYLARTGSHSDLF